MQTFSILQLPQCKSSGSRPPEFHFRSLDHFWYYYVVSVWALVAKLGCSRPTRPKFQYWYIPSILIKSCGLHTSAAFFKYVSDIVLLHNIALKFSYPDKAIFLAAFSFFLLTISYTVCFIMLGPTLSQIKYRNANKPPST